MITLISFPVLRQIQAGINETDSLLKKRIICLENLLIITLLPTIRVKEMITCNATI